MATKVKLYIGIIVALGLMLLTGSLTWFREFRDLPQYLACLALACVASTMKVRLPGLKGTISVNFVFILIGIAELSLSETILLSFAAAIVQCLWRPKTRPKLIQVLFSASTLVISTALAYATAYKIPGGPRALIALALTPIVFFVMNTGMVSLVLALISNKRLLAVWKQCHLWTFPYYLVGAAIAAVVSNSDRTVGWQFSFAALPFMFLVYLYYAAYVSSRAERQEAA